ncbi:MAG: DUF922 domain-containing protein [Litoreibacter sp.]|nr:DUF922 domain-containing protein [Litoreibacter sp.]
MLALGLGFATHPVLAAPEVIIKNRTYKVDAVTAKSLVAQLKRRGPDGFWAYTRWRINWTRDCEVRVRVTYTMPVHSDPKAMPATLRKDWERMITALRLHEEQHGAHGIAAAREIKQAGCKNTRPIVRKYNRADKEFDRRTKHGAKTGVTLG